MTGAARAPSCARYPYAVPDYVPISADPYSAHGRLLKHAEGARTVLDVGCSAGGLAGVLVARGAVVDGIEFDPEAALEARSVCRTVLSGDLEAMELALPESEYDVALLGDIVEHLRDPAAVLRRLRPHLKPGGRIVVSTPNIANWSMRLLHLAGRWDYADRGIMDRTHLRFFTHRTVRRMVEEGGFEVLEVDITCPIPVLRGGRVSGAAHWLGRRWKNLLAYQFIVVGRA